MQTEKKQVFRNICIITVPILNIIGGDTFLKQFIRLIEPLSYKLYIITGGFPNPSSDKVQIIGKRKAWDVTDSILEKIYRYLLAQLRSTLDLIKIARNCEIMILYSGAQLFLIPTLIGKLFGLKILIVHQGSLSSIFKVAYSKRWCGLGTIFFWHIWFLEEIVFFLSNRIVVESQSVIKFLKLKRYRNKLRIGDYTYIDTDLFKVKKTLRERMKLVGYIGQFIEAKGVLNFAKAVPLVMMKCADIEFMMVGKIGPADIMEKELKSTNSYEKVVIMGRVHPEKVPEILNELRLLVLPSVSEGLPGIIRQAMACGTPVLATSVGGIPDLIRDGETGFIMENNSSECIAKNIIRALNHPNLELITSSARALIEKDYTYVASVERYRRIISELKV